MNQYVKLPEKWCTVILDMQFYKPSPRTVIACERQIRDITCENLGKGAHLNFFRLSSM